MKKKLLILTVLISLTLSVFSQFIYPDIRPGYGVTETGWLSDYFEPLKDTNLDTPVFIMDSGVPGATFLLMGGTHAREIATTVSALVFLENAIVKTGRVIVIPFSNRSALSVNDQSSDISHFFRIEEPILKTREPLILKSMYMILLEWSLKMVRNQEI
jgi:hypothetical protein